MVNVIDLGNDTFEVIINNREHILNGPALSQFLDNLPANVLVEFHDVHELCCC